MKPLFCTAMASTVGILVALVLALAVPATAGAQDKAEETKVNINTATVAELQVLPRIGEQVARRIVDFREQNGRFAKIEDLMKVKGIGEKIFLQLKDRITVGKDIE